MFFSFDGIDGAGKSTQLSLFVSWLHALGYSVVRCTDPGSTALGEAVRGIVLEKDTPVGPRGEMLLFMAARAQLVDEVIRPALADGQVVVSDRYLLANIVYQGHAGGLDVPTLWRIGEVATQGIEPDLTYVLDIDPQIATGRIRRQLDRLESRGVDYQTRLRQGFLLEAARRPERIAVVNAAQEVDAVQAEIRSRAQIVLAQSTAR